MLMGLQEEIDYASIEVKTDSYAMSIGELINLYKNKEIDLHPQFQRFFRWSLGQKTKLIESIILGIPLPPIFVAQRPDGIWDVIDGLQRLASIFEFVGELRMENEELFPPLILDGADYLKSLKNKKWDDPNDEENSLTQSQRLYIKRSKIDINIILKSSDSTAKYELFQRLNTGGSHLTSQEVRNCTLLMLNPELFSHMERLANYEPFKECISILTERQIIEQYNVELLLRFITLRSIPEEELKSIGDIGDFLTNKMIEIAKNQEFDFTSEEAAFKYTFDILAGQTKEDTFRKYDIGKQVFKGGFSISAYESISLGIGYHYGKVENISKYVEGVLDKIKTLWSKPEFMDNQGSGVRASTRVACSIPFGRIHFQP